MAYKRADLINFREPAHVNVEYMRHDENPWDGSSFSDNYLVKNSNNVTIFEGEQNLRSFLKLNPPAGSVFNASFYNKNENFSQQEAANKTVDKFNSFKNYEESLRRREAQKAEILRSKAQEEAKNSQPKYKTFSYENEVRKPFEEIKAKHHAINNPLKNSFQSKMFNRGGGFEEIETIEVKKKVSFKEDVKTTIEFNSLNEVGIENRLSTGFVATCAGHNEKRVTSKEFTTKTIIKTTETEVKITKSFVSKY